MRVVPRNSLARFAILGVVVAGVGAASITVAHASKPHPKPVWKANEVNACYHPASKQTRFVKKATVCKPSEKRITWDRKAKHGKDGTNGRDGRTGPRGLRGLVGPVGPVGAIGPIGPIGAPGHDGADGLDGWDGFDGPPGTDGLDGASAYDIAVDAGFTGTVDEWLESLRGDPGPAGPIGDVGPPGAAGEPGVGVDGPTQQFMIRAGSSVHPGSLYFSLGGAAVPDTYLSGTPMAVAGTLGPVVITGLPGSGAAKVSLVHHGGVVAAADCVLQPGATQTSCDVPVSVGVGDRVAVRVTGVDDAPTTRSGVSVSLAFSPA